MPIDPRIALGIEPLKVESPVSMMTNIMQLRNAQKQAELQQQAEHKAQIEEGIKTISGYGNKADAITGLYEAYESDKIDKPHFDRMLNIIKSNPDWDTAKEQILMPLLSAKDQLDLQTQRKQQQQFQDVMNMGGAPAVAPTPTNALAPVLAPVDQEQALFNQLNPQPAAPAAALVNNALITPPTAQTPDANLLRRQINAAYALNTSQGLQYAKYLESQLPKTAEPKYFEQGLGTTTQVISIDPTTGKATVVPGSVAKITPSASEQLARERFEAEKEKGTYSPETIEYLAQMYNQTGTLPTLGLGASGVKMQILDKARQIGTAGGATTEEAVGNVVQAKQTKAAQAKALNAFTSGVESRLVRANNVAINHLSSMEKWGQDLNNTDIRIVNKAANAFAKETGSSAPVSFDAAKQIVGAEVVKAIVQNGGTGAERDEAANAFNTANSPQALADVISKYRILLGGQLEGLQNQYEAGTGRTDFQEKFLLPATRKWVPKKAAAVDNGGDWSDL